MIDASKSLSVRLLLVFMASAIVIVVVLSFLFSYGISTEWRQQIRPHLAQYVSYIRNDLQDPPSIEQANSLAASLPVEIHIFKDGSRLHSTNGLDFDPSRFKFVKRGKRPERNAHRRHNSNFRLNVENLEFAQNRHHSVVKIPLNEHIAYMELDRKVGARGSRRAHLFLLPIVLFALLAILYALLRWLLSPISDIKNGVAIMTAGDLNHQIPIKRTDDLGQLGSSVNGLSSRIQSLLEAKRQLLLSVSHELRSPLTRAQLAANMMPESKYQYQVLEELKLLDALIESLIESERLQSEHAILNLQTIDLNAILMSCVTDAKNEHRDEIESVEVILPDDVTLIQADEIRIRLLIRNLLNNAVQHGKTPTGDGALNSVEKATINVTLQSLGRTLKITIADKGKGVQSAELANLTDAFYRPDPSRAHGQGGVGLGLSLVKLIAEAHGGSLTLDHRSDNGPGLVASVELPAKQAPL